jgi:large subunit ribosomal protein L23
MSEKPSTAATSALASANARRFSPDRLMQVLISPQVSEKTTFVGEKHNQWVFRVRPDATKPEIKAAVELMFKVQVNGVQTSTTKGKETRRLGRAVGRRRSWKKAFVSLKQGQEINFAAGDTK